MPNPRPPAWQRVAGFVALAVAFLLLVAMVVASLFGVEALTCANARLVEVLVALALAMGMTFLGGYAKIGGALPLPQFVRTPAKMSATGGVASFVIVVAVMDVAFARPLCLEPDACARYGIPKLHVSQCKPTAMEDGRLAVVVRFAADGLCSAHHLRLEVAEDAGFVRPLRSSLVIDRPETGQAVVDANLPSGGKGFVRLAVWDAGGKMVDPAVTCDFSVGAP